MNDATHDLEGVLAKLEQAQNRLVESEKMASLGVLTAGIAHEINNLVNVINSTTVALESKLSQYVAVHHEVDVYLKSELSTEQLDHIEHIRTQGKLARNQERLFSQLDRIKLGADRTEEIVRGLRSYSSIDQEAPAAIDINEELKNSLLLMGSHMAGRISIHTNLQEHLPPILGFAGQLNQVFINLLRNAADAITAQGTITVTTLKQGNNLEIRIQDTGTGIAPEIISKVFEPLFTTKKNEGTGLGLYICQSLIQKHGGSISFETTMGQGTVFTITLPASPHGRTLAEPGLTHGM